MKTGYIFIVLLAVRSAMAFGCRKQQPIEEVYVPASLEAARSKAQKPRVKLKYHYDGMGNCGGGVCGSCIGICVYVELKLGSEPTPEELAEGISRIELEVDGNHVLFTPLDLPMDPGSGKALLADVLRADNEVARYLGFSRVELLAGTYDVDCSKGDRYGRIRVPATLVP